MEENQPLHAWFSLMRHLRELPLPQNPAEANADFAEVQELAERIWQNLDTHSKRLKGLQILDQQLGLNRRAWHLALIPRRDLIPHYRQVGELMWAWQAVLEELRADPAFHGAGRQIAGEIWKRFPTDLRRWRARNMVREVFGLDGVNWQIELGILSEEFKQRYRLDQALQLPAEIWDRADPPANRRPTINPDDPASAAAGERL